MHRLQLRRRQPRLRIALIALHLIGRAEFFQQPEDTLRAGVVEVMEGEHGVSFVRCRISTQHFNFPKCRFETISGLQRPPCQQRLSCISLESEYI